MGATIVTGTVLIIYQGTFLSQPLGKLIKLQKVMLVM